MKGFVIKCTAQNVGEKITEYFKSKLNEHLNSNTLLDTKSIKLSQELDKLIVKEQIKLKNLKGC